MDDYLVHYGELQEVCEVAIGVWEQFALGLPPKTDPVGVTTPNLCSRLSDRIGGK